MTLRKSAVFILRTLRLMGTSAMLFAIVAGALGYGQEVKMAVAATGAAGAIAAAVFKASHFA